MQLGCSGLSRKQLLLKCLKNLLILHFLLFINLSLTFIYPPKLLPVQAAGESWLTDFSYRKSISITGSTYGTLSNYQLKITVYSGSGTDSGLNVYLNGKALANYNDLRFTQSDGETLLDYYIETFDATSATVWVKFSGISASPATTTFYMYYGNSEASSVSSASNTFYLYDDFSDGKYNGSRTDRPVWTVTGSASAASGYLQYTGAANNTFSATTTVTTITAGTPVIAEANAYFGTSASCTGLQMRLYGASGLNKTLVGAWADRIYSVCDGTSDKFYLYYNGSQSTATRVYYFTPTNWFSMKAYYNGNQYQATETYKGTTITQNASAYDENITTIYLGGWQNVTGSRYDDIRVRSYVDPEPSITSWGTEEIPVTPTPTPSDVSAPVISNVAVVAQSDSTTVTWITNEASSSQVEYGLTGDYGTSTSETNTSPRVTQHSVTLSDLKSCAKYYFRVKSKDEANNQGVSDQGVFYTTGCEVSSISSGTSSSVEVSGGTVSLGTNQGTVSITAPNNFTTETTTIQINKLDTSTVPSSPSGKNLVDDNYFNLLAVFSSGNTVVTFDQPVTFVVSYGSEVESSYKEETLDVYKYESGSWTKKNCTLDAVANTLTCILSSFSVYGVFGEALTSSSSTSSSSSSLSSTSACFDAKPVGVTDLFQIDTTKDQAALFFTPINGNSKYYISFSTNPSAEEHGAEVSLGSEGVQSFTVNYLSPNTTYYFKVRGQNGCMPGDWSNIKSATTKGLQTAITAIQEIETKKTKPDKKEEPKIQVKTPPTKEKLLANICQYTVKSGDTLWDIAKEVYNDATLYPEIIKDNENKYSDIAYNLDVGWQLSFPCEEEKKDIAEVNPSSIIPEPEVKKPNVKQLVTDKVKFLADMARQARKGFSNSLFLIGQKTQDVSDTVGYALIDLGYKLIDEPTRIYEVKTEILSPTSVKISWKTNQPATGKVNYGLDKTYPFDIQSDKRVTNHEFTLTNLQPDTVYFFELMSQAKSYVYDASREFRTTKE